MGWLDSLFGVPNAPHNWFGGGGGSGNPYGYHAAGPRDDYGNGELQMGDRALRPNFRGQGNFYQLWQRMQGVPNQPPGPYSPPEPPPQFGGFHPNEPAPPRMPPNVPTPWTGGPQPIPPPMQPMRTLPPVKGVIRK